MPARKSYLYGTDRKSGTITLYDSETPLRSVQYKSAKDRSEILEGWRRLYGATFEKLCYHIIPNVKTKHHELYAHR